MSCPSWQRHRTGCRRSPVRTLPLPLVAFASVAPLQCDLGYCSKKVEEAIVLPHRAGSKRMARGCVSSRPDAWAHLGGHRRKCVAKPPDSKGSACGRTRVAKCRLGSLARAGRLPVGDRFRQPDGTPFFRLTPAASKFGLRCLRKKLNGY